MTVKLRQPGNLPFYVKPTITFYSLVTLAICYATLKKVVMQPL